MLRHLGVGGAGGLRGGRMLETETLTPPAICLFKWWEV